MRAETRGAKYIYRSPRELGVQGAGQVSDRVGTEDTPRPWRALEGYPRTTNQMLRFVCLKGPAQGPTGTRAEAKLSVGDSVSHCVTSG